MNLNRKPIIAGNWKMYKTAAEAVALVNALKAEVAGIETVEVVVCPPFTALAAVQPACYRKCRFGGGGSWRKMLGAKPVIGRGGGCSRRAIGLVRRFANGLKKSLAGARRWGDWRERGWWGAGRLRKKCW